MAAGRPAITIIMHAKERIGTHVIHPTFRRENSSFRTHVSWDDIQNWVAEGHEVTIRPPNLKEHQEFLVEKEKYG